MGFHLNHRPSKRPVPLPAMRLATRRPTRPFRTAAISPMSLASQYRNDLTVPPSENSGPPLFAPNPVTIAIKPELIWADDSDCPGVLRSITRPAGAVVVARVGIQAGARV